MSMVRQSLNNLPDEPLSRIERYLAYIVENTHGGDHTTLHNLDVADQHPESAIIGLVGDLQDIRQSIEAIEASSDVVDVVASKAALDSYDTSELHDNDIVKVLLDESRSNVISYYRWVITEGVGAWSYVGEQGPYYTKSETDSAFLALSHVTIKDVTITYPDGTYSIEKIVTYNE